MAEIMKAAEDQGAVVNIIAALNAFKEAPVDLIAQGLGTAAPGILAGIATFVAGAPTAVATAAGLGIGTIMGAGTVKSSIYDATKQTLAEQKDLKLTAKQIEEIAVKAQEYGGKNTDMILGGMILGAIGSYSGAEPIIARELGKRIMGKAVAEEAKTAAGAAVKQSATDTAVKASQKEAAKIAAERGVIKNASIAGGKEFLTEFGQGGQEQLAQNIALQREGMDVPTMRGVVGQGTLEGLAGSMMGAGAGAIEAAKAKREVAEDVIQKEGSDPTTRNVMTTAGLYKNKIVPDATADDINALMPATDKAGKALTDADPDTAAAKTKADTEAAATAAQTKLSLDEATVKANELITKADAGEKTKQSEIRQAAKALGVKIPVGTTNANAIEIIRDNIGQQGAPSGPNTEPIKPADRSGAELAISAEDNAEVGGGGPTATQPGGVVPNGTTARPATTGKAAQSAPLKQQASDLAAHEKAKDPANGMMPIQDSNGNAYAIPLSLFGNIDLNKIVPIFGKQNLATVIRRGGIGVNEAIALLEGLKDIPQASSNELAPKYAAKYPELFGIKPAATKPQLPVAQTNEPAMKVQDGTGQPVPMSALTTPEALKRAGEVLSVMGDRTPENIIRELNIANSRGGLATWEIETILGLRDQKKQQAAPATKTAAQADEDLLNGLLGDDGLPSAGSARRTKAQIETDAKLDQLGKRYGLNRSADESPKDFGARIKEAIEFEKMREGKPLSALSDQDIANQSLREDGSYIPPDLQIDAYEIARQKHNESLERDEEGNLVEGEEELPAYKELSPDDRRVYFQEGLKRPGSGTEQEHTRAAQKLADYRSGVKDETFEGETRSRESYNRERDAFGRKTGLSYSFPAWSTLSDASRQAYAAINKTDTVLEQDMAFRAVKRQLQTEKTEDTAKEKSLEQESRVTNRIRDVIEKSKLKEEDRLPAHVLTSLFKGDIKAVLDYIGEYGNGSKLKYIKENFLDRVIHIGARTTKDGKYKPAYGRPIFKQGWRPIRDSISMGVFRSLAKTLGGLEGLKVNVVFDENMIYDQLARYDSRTNTIYVGPNGLNEATILHELVHAATVKIIHQFYTDASKLTPRARQAVEQLIAIAAEAKKRLGGRFPNAFDNLYEFVSYSQTDIDFQEALHREQVGKLATTTNKAEEQSAELQLQRESTSGATMYDGLVDTLWNAYTGTLAYLYKVFTPNAKSTAILMPTEKSGFARKRTATEVEEGIALEKAARGEKRQTRDLSLSEKEALSPEKLFDNPDEEMDEASIPSAPQDLTTQYGVSNLQRGILREPGFKGNLLLEAAEMFQLILAAPDGGIAQLAGKEGIGSELSAKKPVEEKQTRKGGIYDRDLRKSYGLSMLEKAASKTKEFVKRVTTAKGWRKTFTEGIDRTLPMRYREQQLSRARLIERDPTKFYNNVVEHMDNASGKARNYLIQYIHQPMMELQQNIAALAKLTKQSVDEDILPTLHMLAEAFGEPEKRHMKYVLSVPLSTTKNLMHNGKAISAAQRRIDLMGDPRTGKPGIIHKIELTEAQQKQVRAELEMLTTPLNKGGKYVDPIGDSPRIKNEKIRERALTKRQKKNQLGVMDVNEDSDTYNVLGINKDEVALRLQQFKDMDPAEQEAINKVMASIRKITAATAELNKIGNYWSYPVSNIVGIYDYQNYMPFKGLAKHSIVDEMIEPDGGRTKTSRILIDEEKAAHGRFTVSDNPILQTMSDAFRSAGRAGRSEYMQAILNASNADKKKNPNGTGVIDADVVERVEFADRDTTDLSKYKGKSYIFVPSSDGSLSIIKVNEPDILQSLRYQYKQNGFLMDLASQLTSMVGSMHTRWNMNFAAKNFISDTLQNAWNIGAGTTGPLSSLKYLIDTASTTVAKNGLGKSMEVAMLYENGDEASNRILRNMAAKDEFVAALIRMLKFGGKTAYIQSMSLKSSLEQLEQGITKNGATKTIEAVGKVADVWGSMFEFTSRTAAFQLFEREYLKREIEAGTSNDRDGQEMSPAEYAAAVRAAADTKNLTNFELVGSSDKAVWMSTFYMFFKASAVSSLRTMESLAPMFRRMKWAEAELPATIRENPEALNNWRKEYKNLQGNAQIMFGALAGFGYSMYIMSMMMAPEDEWKRNATKSDNMDQWVRYARFHLPKSVLKAMGMREDTVIQIPWGFGLGAIASTGAQMAGMVHGESSIKKGLSNILAGSLADAFFPLPISKMPWSEMAGLAAFDTVTPSILRPLFEYYVNTDGVGRAINSTSNRRLGDAYTGSDRVPQVYKDLADYMFRVSGGDFSWPPNAIHFFANSYIDGVARVAEIGYSLAAVSKEEKLFNPKTDLPLFGSFFGAKGNVDAREYSSIESQIKKMDKTIYTMKKQDPSGAIEYEQKHPFDKTIVEMYNRRQGELNKLRQKATEIRTDRNISPAQKEAMIKIAVFEQNIIKHEMVQDFKAYGLKP
jgi:hypothetical protein